jgi:hypothetical protein
MKGITYSIVGILIGGFCGLIFAGGEMNYVKKSQRGTFSPIYSIVFAVVGGAVGLGIGMSNAEDERKTKALGLDNINSTKLKEGRKWLYQSEWINPSTNEKYILKTFYDKQTDNTITTLNEELHTNHYTNTGAEKFVSKAHFDVLDIVKSYLKNSIS